MSTIRITINGAAYSIPKGLSLGQALNLLMESAPDDRAPIATALNGQHVSRTQRDQAFLSEGDQITTFEPITGG